MYVLEKEDRETFGEFTYAHKYERDGEYITEYTHPEDAAAIRFIRAYARYRYTRIEFVQEEYGTVETAFGNIPNVYVEDAVSYYEEHGHFGESPLVESTSDITLDDIDDQYELPDVPEDNDYKDGFEYENHMSNINIFIDEQPIESFNGTEGKLLESFLEYMHGYLWLYGHEVRWSNMLTTEGYLSRLEYCYGYDPALFLDDSWVEYAAELGHITLSDE